MCARPMPGTGFSGTVEAEVLAFEPMRMLRVGWRDANPGSAGLVNWTITWTLQPEGRGTRLFLLHEGFDPDNPLQQRARNIMGGGWRTHTIRRLNEALTRLSER
nr:SRPBCC domain-containing protein [Nonomuraea mesophila]